MLQTVDGVAYLELERALGDVDDLQVRRQRVELVAGASSGAPRGLRDVKAHLVTPAEQEVLLPSERENLLRLALRRAVHEVAEPHVEGGGDPRQGRERCGGQVAFQLADEAVRQPRRSRELRDRHPPLLAQRPEAIANRYGDGHAAGLSNANISPLPSCSEKHEGAEWPAVHPQAGFVAALVTRLRRAPR